jgi:hypothetical protein
VPDGKPRPLIIDTPADQDDFMAVLYLLLNPNIEASCRPHLTCTCTYSACTLMSMCMWMCMHVRMYAHALHMHMHMDMDINVHAHAHVHVHVMCMCNMCMCMCMCHVYLVVNHTAHLSPTFLICAGARNHCLCSGHLTVRRRDLRSGPLTVLIYTILHLPNMAGTRAW